MIYHYQPIDEYRRQNYMNRIICLIFLFIGIFFFFHLFGYFTFWNSTIIYLYLNEEAFLIHVTSDKFLSFGIDSSLLRETKFFPLNDERFLNLAKHLSPAFVRIGGTASDCLFFNETNPTFSTATILKFNPNNITNFTINGNDFKSLNKFSTKAKLRMIFDLNVLIRHTNNSWDTTNANKIISFAKTHNYQLDWQLGNEPNSFKHVFHREISGQQLAKDYKILRKLLNDNGFQDSLIFGPETNHIGDIHNNGVAYAKQFFINSDNNVNYLTWHQYYLNGREAKVEDFLNITVFNYLPNEINSFNKIFGNTNKSLPVCLSETSTAYGGGAPELSDRFVAGFLWLDKLGYSAASGLKIVIRQSFYGGNYAMIGPDLKPNPDWWISVLFKQLVSQKVLKLKAKNLNKNLRIYAHCTTKKALLNRVPAATVYGISLNKHKNINIALGGEFDSKKKMFAYIFTANSLHSREIILNGNILKLQLDGSLPQFDPVIYSIYETISIPPLSMFFIVVHGINISACTSE